MKLITYPGSFGEPSASPFCVKAMCLLEMTKQPWAPKYVHDPRKAPKAKFPVLKDEEQTIADSDHIRDYLENKYNVDFDEGLSTEQRAMSRAVIRMVEEHLYFALVCDRWINDDNWAKIKIAFFGHIPFPINPIVTRLVRKQAIQQFKAQGMGRHTPEERFDRAKKDVTAIVGILNGKPFLFGDTATAADASVIPMLRAITITPVATDLTNLAKQNEKLLAYIERGREAIYPKLNK
ncbi:MAG: glutathione S-transferase family protein [Rhodospirillales bacterium]|nr:glutathione S-transferase family protein [Rhodospirillales bacterium]